MIPIASVIAADLGPTPTYSRREMRAIVGGVWDDGRDGTVWLDMHTAKNRYRGKRRCASVLSRYAVSEVEEVGFMGRSFVWDKEFPEQEHGDQTGLPQPPYTVRLDVHGSIWCQCMGDKGGQAESCRHCDATLYLIDEGAFGDDAGPVF